jgi:hypothetical protein
MTDLNKKGVLLDAARRQFYLKSQKHLKEHIVKKDNTAAPAPREDSDAALSGRQHFAIFLRHPRQCWCGWSLVRCQRVQWDRITAQNVRTYAQWHIGAFVSKQIFLM